MNLRISVLGIMTVTGCASTSPTPAFRDMAQLVASRTSARVTWNKGGGDDAAVAGRVRALLARELTADSAVQVALLNNRSLQATYEDLSISQADLVQAGLLQNPTLGAGLVFPVAGIAQTGGNVSVVEDFLGVFTLAARERVARAELEATKLRVANEVLSMAFDVETAFYALQSAQQVAAMRRTVLDTGDATMDLTHRQRAAGNVSDLDVATQETLYEQLRADLARSESEVIRARETLARLLGVWGADGAFRVGEKLPELPPEEVSLDHLESVAIGRRLDLAAAREGAQAVSHALAMAKNTPRVSRWPARTRASSSHFLIKSRLSSLDSRHNCERHSRVSKLLPWTSAPRSVRRAVASLPRGRSSSVTPRSSSRCGSASFRYRKSSTTQCFSARTSFSKRNRAK
jgi:cobalt-zinc-cadmium efflux system outer membrane protein